MTKMPAAAWRGGVGRVTISDKHEEPALPLLAKRAQQKSKQKDKETQPKETTCIPGKEATGNSSWSNALSPSSEATPVVSKFLKSNLE